MVNVLVDGAISLAGLYAAFWTIRSAKAIQREGWRARPRLTFALCTLAVLWTGFVAWLGRT